MLAEINEAKVVATLSNDTTKDIPVVWNEVVETEGVYKVLGSVKVVDHNIISTVHNIDVEVKLTVVDVLESVSIAKAPTKVEYKVGEALDLAGAKLKLTMASGATSEVEITSAMVTGFDSSTPGTVTVSVTYEGKTTTFTVTIVKAEDPVSKKGCKGSIAASIIGLSLVLGVVVFIKRRK